MAFDSIDQLETALREQKYIAERGLSTAIYLALKLQRPLLLEGEAGVGKTEVAKVLGQLLDTELIRLQCYEGLDIHQAVYEWNYTRQLLHIRRLEAQGEQPSEAELFGPEFLLARPLLEAIQHNGDNIPVLLIDELDRSDEEFEAYLLEILSDFQISIPELGTISAKQPPVVIITSNRTREVHDAIKRRCIYNWIEYPSFEKELKIVLTKTPGAPEALAQQVTAFIQKLREQDLYKLPGIAETLDWANALMALNQTALSVEVVNDTLGVVLKYHDDVQKVQGEIATGILEEVV
ncbi:MAG: MoxR family ATPase [Chloroflexi bacterium]|nr:MAG: MoxR family ATPase [Chloroflexota bacterium]